MSIIQRVMEKKQGEKSDEDSSHPLHETQEPAILKVESTDKYDIHIDDKDISPAGQSSSNNKIVFNFEQMQKEGFLTPADTESQLAEEYRRIKRPLLVNAFAGTSVVQNSNTVLITSSQPGEGKTYTALNLAMSISLEKEKTVLLVDADLMVSGLTKRSNLFRVPGLSDVLNQDIHDLSEVIYGTNLDNLKILPAGTRKKDSAELLASNEMQLLVNELSNRYPDRIIIIDSPPLLARSESSVLAKLAGQVVLVVEAEQTMQHTLKEAIEQLEECEIVNLLLNKRHNRPGLSYHTGYYGY